MHALCTLLKSIGNTLWVGRWVSTCSFHTSNEGRSHSVGCSRVAGWVDGSLHAVYTLTLKVGHTLWMGRWSMHAVYTHTDDGRQVTFCCWVDGVRACSLHTH